MEISENLLCLYSVEVTKQGDSHVIEVPEREVTTGAIDEGDTYKMAMLPAQRTAETESTSRQEQSGPPVDEGDVVDVEIENIGDQGDGIARVGPGYVVIIPDTEVGERVSVEITEARENVSFAEVVKRYDR